MAELRRAVGQRHGADIFFMFAPMELKDIPNRLKAMNRSQADLARHLELDPSSLTKTIQGRRRVQAAEVIRIQEFFGDKLLLDDGGPGGGALRRTQTQRRVPVYGYAAPGHDDLIAFGEAHVLEWREPPPYWTGGGLLAYARIRGEAMEPRYFSGELVPIRLGVEPAKHEDCLVEMTDGTAQVRRYDGRKSGLILLHQYNPEAEMKLDATKVRNLHAVWRPTLI